MRKLKVLPLERWMSCPDEVADCVEPGRIEQMQARVKRPGWYLQGDTCWFETPDGKAYTYIRSYFCHNLAVLNALQLNHRQVAALASVVKEGLATKEQRSLLANYQDAMHLRAIRRGVS